MAKQKINGAQATLYRNLIVNGSARVAQRAAPNLSTTSQYGKVDRFRVHATGTAVSAGTINQTNADSVGTAQSTLLVSGATITGTGIVFVKHRIESYESAYLVNQTASFSCVVRHDVGSNINYTITVRKPTVVDNFASVTDILVGSATSVVTATTTTIKLENISMGDVTNGIEIEISAACGAVTTKNFKYTDFQLNKGTVAMEFVPFNFVDELRQCQRYYETGRFFFVAYSVSTNIGSSVFFKATKRATPTVVQTNVSTAGGASASPGQADVDVYGFLSFRGSTLTGSAQFNETWTAEVEL